MYKFILGVVFTATLMSVSGNGDSRDEINVLRETLPELEGSERLNALYLIYQHTDKLGDTAAERAALYAYLEEALRQQDDAGIAYAVNRLSPRMRIVQFVAAVIILALLAVFTIYFIYSCRLKKKNRTLSEQLREINRLRTWQLTHLLQGPGPDVDDNPVNGSGNTHKKNEELVWLACRKMVEDKLFRDPALNRKQLADILGTNENYLAAAIREVNEGQTVGDFINGFRLDYACGLITDCPSMTLEMVANESGLMTRSTLFRLFLKKFGMSPSQYRTEQIKERKLV